MENKKAPTDKEGTSLNIASPRPTTLNIRVGDDDRTIDLLSSKVSP